MSFLPRLTNSVPPSSRRKGGQVGLYANRCSEVERTGNGGLGTSIVLLQAEYSGVEKDTLIFSRPFLLLASLLEPISTPPFSRHVNSFLMSPVPRATDSVCQQKTKPNEVGYKGTNKNKFYEKLKIKTMNP
jgi:hypothetical protein